MIKEKLKQAPFLLWPILIIVAFLIGGEIGWSWGYKDALDERSKTVGEGCEAERQVASDVVKKSAELSNLSELKYTMLARETTQCEISDKQLGNKLSELKGRQDQILSDLNELMKKLGIQQDIIPIPAN